MSVVNVAPSQPPALVYAGLDESGSLTADSPFFSMAVVITPQPRDLRHLIRRAVMRSGKRLGRYAKDAGEIKWRNASQRIRELVLAELAVAEVNKKRNSQAGTLQRVKVGESRSTAFLPHLDLRSVSNDEYIAGMTILSSV